VKLKLTKFAYTAVIFDLDGVLADTEPLNYRAIQDMFDPAIVQLDQLDYSAVYGLDYYDTAEHLRRRYRLDEPVASLARRQEECALRRIDLELQPAPGAVEFIRMLASLDIPLGLASNSPNVYVIHVLQRLGVQSFFPFPVGRDDVANGKPAPDPYLEACKRLGVKPGLCLAVEDSSVGMQSALTAGLDVALVGLQAPEPPSKRVTRSNSIADLASLYLSN
jgi:HAD superfamily hydrolase (TIGR01509 family)